MLYNLASVCLTTPAFQVIMILSCDHVCQFIFSFWLKLFYNHRSPPTYLPHCIPGPFISETLTEKTVLDC